MPFSITQVGCLPFNFSPKTNAENWGYHIYVPMRLLMRRSTGKSSKVLATFPQLANPPPHYHKPVKETPYRLYRYIALVSKLITSAEDRLIVFIGQIGVGNYFPIVECQSMWATAYLDRKLETPSWDVQEKNVTLFTAWCRRRYLSGGERGNNMTFELIGYMDGLLEDLGLSSHRKGWIKDLLAPSMTSDFAGLKEEFIQKYGYNESGK
ncbi:uncharacterized protein BP5553_02956 [Venustampulla echinocandica]|uniref:Uncharacterized protein n=1 Tax=Venustampulla echinocandica TaxID=2656787 RepID=A0A370TSV4_9HELO|nr:uncharacterized protein BP5553_02956 [Venustampulla echinocandica]RDL38616.1 hypothetical protein BP5553_02956 [Venustampulla echinocandica]